MALGLSNDVLESGIVVPNAYVRIGMVMGDRHGMSDVEYESRTNISTEWYVWDGEVDPAKNAIAYRRKNYNVDGLLAGDASSPNNILKLAYDALKTLDDFADAIDV